VCHLALQLIKLLATLTYLIFEIEEFNGLVVIRRLHDSFLSGRRLRHQINLFGIAFIIIWVVYLYY